MTEREIKAFLQQLLDEQKKLREEMKELQQRLDKMEARQETTEQPIPDKILEHQQPEAVELWNNVLTEVKERISPRSFHTWFKATQAVQIKADSILVWCSNEFARDWLHARYSDLIEDILQDRSTTVRHVHFVASEEGYL
jgi:cell division septum initiation protein DivIVA